MMEHQSDINILSGMNTSCINLLMQKNLLTIKCVRPCIKGWLYNGTYPQGAHDLLWKTDELVIKMWYNRH